MERDKQVAVGRDRCGTTVYRKIHIFFEIVMVGLSPKAIPLYIYIEDFSVQMHSKVTNNFPLDILISVQGLHLLFIQKNITNKDDIKIEPVY